MSSSTLPVDRDAERLQELGYRQELARGLNVFDNAALGVAAISPVVGLYAVVLVGTVVAGPAWVWVLPVALAGQCLLLAVYAELASEFPIAGGAYQWSRRLIGRHLRLDQRLGRDLRLLRRQHDDRVSRRPLGAHPRGRHAHAERHRGHRDDPRASSARSSGALGVDVLGAVIRVGIAAEIVASVGIGLALLLVFRTQDLSILTHTLGAEALSGGSVGAGMLAALAVAGWVFIGFDACVSASEETRGAARHVPRAIWLALLSVAALVILNAFAVTLAHPDPAGVVAGRDADPVTTSVVTSFGSWSAKPFAAVVLAAFLACGTAAQALTARTIYSIARDDVLPGLTLPAAGRRASGADRRDRDDDRRGVPRPAAGPALGCGGQPDRLRDGRDLRRLPARRARRARRARCAARGYRPGTCGSAAQGSSSTRSPSRGSRSRPSTSRGRARRWHRRARRRTRSGRP